MDLCTYGKGCIDGDCFWFVSAEYPFLCKVDMKRRVLADVIVLDDTPFMNGSHYVVTQLSSKIVLCPTRDKIIYIFDSITNSIQSLEISEADDFREKIVDYSLYSDFVYMFPREYPYIIRLNVFTSEIKYIKCDYLDEHIGIGSNELDQVTYIGNKAYLNFAGSKNIFVFDMQDETGTMRTVESCNGSIKAICSGLNNQMIIIDEKSNLIVMDEELKEILIRRAVGNVAPFSVNYYSGGYIVLPYSYKEDIILLSGDLNVIKSFRWSPDNIKIHDWRYHSYSRVAEGDNKFAFFNIPSNELLIIDKEKKELYKVSIDFAEIGKEKINNIFNRFFKDGNLKEDINTKLSLKAYIDCIKEKN